MGKLSVANWRKTIYYLKRNGLQNTVMAAAERFFQKREEYRYEAPSGETLQAQKCHVFSENPLISILVPLYRTPEPFLRQMISSVIAQSYQNWELLLADATEDESLLPVVGELIKQEQQKGHDRIRYLHLTQNLSISENTNQALDAAQGAYIGLLDHDDLLTPDALYEMAVRIEAADSGHKPLMLYSDEDKCDGEAQHFFEPHRKQDFNLDLLLSNNYICHFLLLEAELFRSIPLRREYNGAQDFDLVLRAAGRILPEEDRIVHIPRVLYHWRCHTGSTAENPQSKTYAYEAGRRAVQAFADAQGWKAKSLHLKHLGFYGLCYEPSVLQVREDVGAVGGTLFHHGKIVGGGLDREGRVLFQGLRRGYSGYMHRAVLTQETAAADLRCLCLSERWRELFEKTVGVPYVTVPGEERFDERTLPEGSDVRALSRRLGEALRAQGARVLWNPGWQRKI